MLTLRASMSTTALTLAGLALASPGAGDGAVPPATVTITATDFALEAPHTVAGGVVTLRLRNRGLVAHHAWVVRLDGARGLRDLERELVATRRLPAWAVDVGGPNAVAAGAEGWATLSLAPGRHVVLCAAAVGDGTLALMRGMYRALEVVTPAPGAPPAAPPADATLELGDGALHLHGRLVRGRSRLRVRNLARATRELRLYRLSAPGADGALRRWLAHEVGAPPAHPAGGVIGLAPGASAVLDLDLPAGSYALVGRAPAARDAPAEASVVIRLVWVG